MILAVLEMGSRQGRAGSWVDAVHLVTRLGDRVDRRVNKQVWSALQPRPCGPRAGYFTSESFQ